MKIYYKNKHWKLDEDYNIDKILYLLIDRPTRINSYNGFIWKNKKGQFHREYDLPAYVSINETIEWCKYNNIHRNNDKPSRIFYYGYKQYCINGKFIKETK